MSSKTVEMFKRLKEENNSKIYFFNIGYFYIALADDAYFLSKKYNFKLTNFTSDILKCGFPCTSFKKYYSKFKNDNLNFEVIEKEQLVKGQPLNKNFSEEHYIIHPMKIKTNKLPPIMRLPNYNSKEINKLLTDIDSFDINNCSVSDAFKFIENIKKASEKLIETKKFNKRV